MEQANQEDERYLPILRSNPRILRAAAGADIPSGDPVALVSTQVLGPALGGFTQWLLSEAIEEGKKRLYFLARDGYFLYRAARIFCTRFQLPLECRYLCCSRYSLRLPLFHRNTGDALAYVCRGGIGVTPKKILRRAGLTDDEQAAVLEALALPWSPNAVIPHLKLPEIQEQLAACSLFLDAMNRHSRQAAPGMEGYLRQEGLLEENIPDGIVDSGWTGSIQKALMEALHTMGRTRKLDGYYFGLYELPVGVNRRDYHAYYFEPEGQLRQKIFFNNCLFETLFTAPHGMTLFYQQTEGRTIPRFGGVSLKRIAFIRQTGSYLLDYTRRLADQAMESGDWRGNPAEDRAAIYRLLRRFMSHPSRPEAEIFGKLSFSDDVLEGEERPIAARLTEEELTANHPLHKLPVMAGIRPGTIKESAWYEGSAVLAGRHIRRHLRQYTLYQYLRHSRKMRRWRRERQES